jgi:hypothetical protein
MILGDVRAVQGQLEDMSSGLGVEEFMLVTVVHSHEARKHSYELLAKAFDLSASST